MIDLNIKLYRNKNNYVPIVPKSRFDSKGWNKILSLIEHEKLGFIMRRTIGAMPGENIFFFKNYTIHILSDDIAFTSNLEYNSDQIVNGSVLSGMWSTSLYVSFFKNYLFKTVIQVMGDPSPLRLMGILFIETCYNRFSNMRGEIPKIIWSDNDSEMRFTLLPNLKTFHIMNTYYI